MTETPTPLIKKVGAFVIRQGQDGLYALLLFNHADLPDVPVQIPGGSVEPGGETPQEAVHREVLEEAGLANLQLIRKLCVFNWFWEDRRVWIERHVFLLEAPPETPDEWIHIVTGNGEDHQLRFAYYWIRPWAEFRLGGEFDAFLTAERLPELYAQSNS